MAHYVHCAACRRAFDATAGARCPACPEPPAAPRHRSLIEEVGAASPAELEALRAAIDARLPRQAELVMLPSPAPVARVRRTLVDRAIDHAIDAAARLVGPLGAWRTLRRRLIAAVR